MNIDWKLIYYEDQNGYSEVLDFINSLKENDQVKLLSWISILEEKGPNLPRPYSDLLKDGIHELRIKLSGTQIRILYFFCYREFIILTNKFVKNAKKVPEKEILKAIELKNKFLQKYNNYKKLLEEYNENT
jgi:hypothetical protein